MIAQRGFWASRFASVVFLALFMLTASRAPAATGPALRDEANVVGESAAGRVNAIINQIHAETGKDLTIRIFPAIPENLRAELTPENKEAFYESWLRREARTAETNGVFVLIVKQPGRLQIGVGNQTRQKAFTNADRDEMRDLMLAKLREKQFDAALTDGALFVLHRMEKNEGLAQKDVGQARTATSAPATQPDTAVQPSVTPSPRSAPTTQPKPDAESRPTNGVEYNK